MSRARQWDVTVGGRIENVTDHDDFADRFQESLTRAEDISLIEFNRSPWPHSTSIVIRVSADSKLEAERRAREQVLPVLSSVAKEILGAANFGWTMRADATPVSRRTGPVRQRLRGLLVSGRRLLRR